MSTAPVKIPANFDELAKTIGHIAGMLGHEQFPTGERAALRRMTPGQSLPLAFYRFALQHLPPSWEASADSRRDWATLVAGIALMSPGAHRPERPLGKALAGEKYAESRLERLLSARGDVRRILLLRAVRFLAAKHAPFNWLDAARLLLVRDPEKREAVHRQIARDYYSEIND